VLRNDRSSVAVRPAFAILFLLLAGPAAGAADRVAAADRAPDALILLGANPDSALVHRRL
jgi:hypothetical protein